MTERIDEPDWKLWLLLDADRQRVTIGLGVVVFVVIVATSTLAPGTLRELMATEEPVRRLFQALTVSLITGVTVVVTINQLVLSQEIGAVSDQRQRIEGSLAFRRNVGEVIEEDVVPPRPEILFVSLLKAVATRARAFREAAATSGIEETEVDSFIEGTLRRAHRVSDELEDARFGTFEVVSAILRFDYSNRIVEADRVASRHGNRFGEEAELAYENLRETLELYGLARENFKTLYFQWALVDLSQSILTLFVPALVVTVSMLLFLDPTMVEVTLWRIDGIVVLIALAATVSISPFLLVVTYLLRVSIVAKRTLTIGPFVLRGSQ